MRSCPSLNGDQAKLMRGAQLLRSGKLVPRGAPGSPGNTIPVGALGKRRDLAPGIIENSRFCVSVLGVLYSYRKPAFTVSRGEIFQSSWAKPKKNLLRMFEAA